MENKKLKAKLKKRQLIVFEIKYWQFQCYNDLSVDGKKKKLKLNFKITFICF